MTQQAEPTPKEFSCSAATIYFIYSLSFAKNPEEKGEKVLGGGFLDVKDIKNFPKEKEWKKGSPPPHIGITPDLIVRQNCWFRELPSQEGSVINPNLQSYSVGKEVEVEVEVKPLVRVFPFGATCRIAVIIKSKTKPITEKHLYTILGLMDRTTSKEDTPSKLILDSRKKEYRSLYSFFSESINSICNDSGLVWLCDKGEYIVKESQDTEPQSPWVVLVAQVDEPDIAEAFCSSDFSSDYTDTIEEKRERIKPYVNSVASLLFLSAEGKTFPIEPAYLPTAYDKGELGLYNLGVDARFFISMSRRSILCICRNVEKAPANYLLPGVLEISELVRMRWHMLIIMNKMLDKIFDELEKPGGEAAGKLQLIILIRQWLAKSLDDPGLYIIAGDALSRIYKKLQDTFRLIDLRRFLFDKITILEKNYQDLVNWDWLSGRK